MATKKTTSRAKGTRKVSKARRPGSRDSRQPAASREGSETKASKVLALLRSKAGTTLPDLMAATGWQAHSIRGFLSGTVKKRMALPLISEQTVKGRRYKIEERTQAPSRS